MEGTVARLVNDKGFGFIECDRRDYFFHRSAVQDNQFDMLHIGTKVKFRSEDGPKGPRAVDVEVVF